jgi:hydroxymethylpyrimidine/phosphomethylpyrimidine kinase
MIPNVLTIAGSDPSGGAGIQADLKAFSALGAYGMSVLTGLTAQNTVGVRAVFPVPAEFVVQQLDAVFDDVRVDAVKIGMLASSSVVDAVATVLSARRPPFVVLDPVMVAKSGDRLLPSEAVSALRDRLLPLVDLVTPNLPEAADLLGPASSEAASVDEMAAQALAIAKSGPAVLLKGGHLGGPSSPDLFLASPSSSLVTLSSPRIVSTNDHGTGCTLSSAIAALRPQHSSLEAAIRAAKAYLTAALAASSRLEVGRGHGPVHHFHEWW